MANPIRPEDLPVVPSLAGNDALIVDTGAGVYKTTPVEVATAGLEEDDGSIPRAAPGMSLKAWIAQLLGSVGSSLVGFLQSGTGAIARTVQEKAREQRSVLDFIPVALHAGIAARTYTGDLSAYVDAAIAKVAKLYFPSGNYHFNSVLPAGFGVYGDPARFTILKPFDADEAVFKVVADVFWSYSRSFTDVQFEGSGKTGIGVAIGCLGPADYVSGDEFANTVAFTRCRFNDLEKGIVCGAGNLGLEFYSSNFHANYYGAYFLNQKVASGDDMHAGCKYFFGCEFDYNNVGVYINNTTDGFGGVCFHSTIIEASGIDVYCYSTNTRQPIAFIDCWTENASDTGFGPNITVDTWTGETKGTVSLPTADFVFDGADSDFMFKGGFVSGVHVMGANIRVDVDCAGVETKTAFNGAPFIVTAPTTSRVYLRGVRSVGGIDAAEGVLVEDFATSTNYTISASNTDRKQFPTLPRFNKQAALGGAGVTNTYEAAGDAVLTVGSGPATPVAGTVVSDGQIYDECSQWVLPFTAAGQFYQLPSSVLAAQVVGWWYVASIDVKKTGGTPTVYIGDLGSNQLMANFAPAGTGWNTLAAIGQATTTGAISLTVSTTTAATATIRVSAYQIRGFPTRSAAEAYLRAAVYATP